ncbi:hypothetical protein GCM10007853_21050 [Algimonas ampicilliniresistens]|uniref:Methyltransferase type 11 domain-containing protein n=1 Tax=Algimonas ampicilliniresistens TaxID=1298735 RepID=A0ABQ5VCA7_9PROT|nr:class I SAM-dependent methyltransferase [Algimonas ampicilliniresistens]GLQ24231.1 hypothetical protein GCM10007853_21050 [Algimonas ampicilliniresistens]
MTAHTQTLGRTDEPESIPVVEGWVGNWRISLRRRNYSNDELCDLYEVQARDWDDGLSSMRVPEAYHRIHTALDTQGEQSLDTPKRVLDCGIGTGAFSTALIKSTPYPIELHGVDISPEMISCARKQLERYGVTPHLSVADARSLPYGDNQFDLVMAAHMLEHLAEPQATLAEMTRVLKPGGRLLLCITRNSLLGRHIQLKWRTHAINRQTARRWLQAIGLSDIQFPKPHRQPAFNNRTLVCSARKRPYNQQKD